VLAVATSISAPLCMLALFAVVKMKRGATLGDTYALGVPPLAVLGRWLLAAAAFFVASDLFTWMLGKPIVPEFMLAVYRTADDKVMFCLVLFALAPAWEELLFRGLVVSGLRPSRLGASGAIALSAFAWALMHAQYELYGIATIFLFGLMLGAARVHTGSIAVPVAMHALSNVLATIEAAIQAAASS
jgi:CAAX protease family protein